jgi:cytochrome c oxidase assembly protein subunit 20
MAGESPDPGAPAAPVEPPAADGGEAQRKPKHKFPKSQLGQLWDEFGNPQDRPNLMGNYDSAGRPPKELTYLEAAKTLSAETMSSFYKTACARDSLLIAIGTGFGVGGIAAVLGGGLIIRLSLWDGLLLVGGLLIEQSRLS